MTISRESKKLTDSSRDEVVSIALHCTIHFEPARSSVEFSPVQPRDRRSSPKYRSRCHVGHGRQRNDEHPLQTLLNEELRDHGASRCLVLPPMKVTTARP